MNGDHLSPKTRELLDRPIEERIAHIQKDSWIPYSQANKILQQLAAEPGDLGSDQQWKDAAQ
jgi:hypothetical protein